MFLSPFISINSILYFNKNPRSKFLQNIKKISRIIFKKTFPSLPIFEIWRQTMSHNITFLHNILCLTFTVWHWHLPSSFTEWSVKSPHFLLHTESLVGRERVKPARRFTFSLAHVMFRQFLCHHITAECLILRACITTSLSLSFSELCFVDQRY